MFEPTGTPPTPVWNDNRGCVDWTKGYSVSKKLRHMNMRELGVRLAQLNGDIDVRHIEGKRNIADLFTKEIKYASHFQEMAFTITTPRLVADLEPQHLTWVKGGVESQTQVSTQETTMSQVTQPTASAPSKLQRLASTLTGTLQSTLSRTLGRLA
jgi:hypothetical protein